MRKRLSVERAIRRIAGQEGRTFAEVHREMELVIEEAMQNPDPAVQARWKEIPCKGSAPTPEELILYAAQICRGMQSMK